MIVKLLGTSASGAYRNRTAEAARTVARRDPGQGSSRPGCKPPSPSAPTAAGGSWSVLPRTFGRRSSRFRRCSIASECEERRLRGFLASGDLDHVLGLFELREETRLDIHATAATWLSLDEGLNLSKTLGAFLEIHRHEPTEALTPLPARSGKPGGLLAQAFRVPGKPPKYREGRTNPRPDDAIGYRIEDPNTGGRAAIIPSLAAQSDSISSTIKGCDLLLIDSAFWGEHELVESGGPAVSASSMGHLALGGTEGGFADIAQLGVPKVVYIHINHTNPILHRDSIERRRVEAAGVVVGEDGMEFRL